MNASRPDRSPSVDDVGPFADLPTTDQAGHVQRTWLRYRVMATIELDRGGGYRWDPAEYQPIPIEEEGEAGFAFAKVRG